MPKPLPFAWALGRAASLSACLALAGCAASGRGAASKTLGAPGDSLAVTAAQTPFYSFGPAQSQGPDTLLTRGDLVTLVRRESGFSKVRTAAGGEGYIANDRLVALPASTPEPVPKRHAGQTARIRPLEVMPLERMFEEPPLPAGGGSAGY